MGKQAAASTWPGRIVGIVAAVVIVALAVRLVYGFLGPKPDPYKLAWYVCDEKGTYFAARRAVPPVECPACKARTGVPVSWLTCRSCSHVYEGLRCRPVPGREDEFYPRRPGELPVQQIKYGGGEWLEPGSSSGIRLVRRLHQCPKCGSTQIGAVDPATSAEESVPPGVKRP